MTARPIRIEQVSLRDFRGVRGNLDVSLLDKNGRAVSALLVGDNGSGKSTIVDAIEWACQGSRRPGMAGSRPVGLINLASAAHEAHARVVLNNGQVVERTIRHVEDDRYQTELEGSTDDFSRAPMILKRHDILHLMETKPVERGALFLHLNLADAEEPTLDLTMTETFVADDSPTLTLKRRIREKAVQLAKLVHYQLPDTDLSSIDELVEQGVYRGVRHGRGNMSVRLPNEQDQLVRDIGQLRLELKSAQRAERRARRRTPGKAEAQVALLGSILSDVDNWMTASFRDVTGSDHVRRIAVRFAESGRTSIDFAVELANGRATDPQSLFSEGYNDLVSLLFFLAALRASARLGQAKVLILDDVFQSVDAPIRVSVMDLIAREFSEWQLVVTVHDRLWRTQVAEILRRHGHSFVEVDLAPWEFSTGAGVGAAAADPAAGLRAVLPSSDAGAISALSGRLLEQIADRLSYGLRVSVQRRRGDLYTLADLWPGVAKQLRRLGAAEVTAEADKWSHLRNVAGAHYNEWAEALPLSDASRFANATLALLERVYCDRCQSWLQATGPRSARCACGTTLLGELS